MSWNVSLRKAERGSPQDENIFKVHRGKWSMVVVVVHVLSPLRLVLDEKKSEREKNALRIRLRNHYPISCTRSFDPARSVARPINRVPLFLFYFLFFSLAVAVAAIIVSVRTITIGAVPIDAGFSALQLVPLRAFSHGPRRRPRRFRPWESASSSARLAFRWEMSPFLLKKKCSFPPFFRLTPKTDFCLFHRWELDGSSPDSERVGPLFWNSNSGFRSLRANFRRVK